MSELLSQLGIDGKLLLAQGANFLIVLGALTFLAYRPLVKILEERRKKIEFGLKGAEEAERRLSEIDKVKIEKLKQADEEALLMIRGAEGKAIVRSQEIIKGAESKAGAVLEEAVRIAEQKKLEEFKALSKEAKEIIKKALVKTVELDPTHIDEKLIARAVERVNVKKV
jgi:F-type H+-transporting ATPase subunit b